MNAPVLRCSRCHRVRDAPGQPWADHPAKLPREVEGTCSLCMELSRLLSERKWQREGRDLLRGRERGFAGLTPIGDVFAGFREKGEPVKSGDAFKGTYLKAEDIKGKQVAVTIEEVTMEEVGQGNDKTEKPVLHFRGKDKGLVLNRTNWGRITDLLGSDDSDDWAGKAVVLGTERVDFQGRRVDAIRVIGLPKKGQPVRAPEPEPEPEAEADYDPNDDDVPF